eukprot:1698119-Amphidinium_carterae.1
MEKDTSEDPYLGNWLLDVYFLKGQFAGFGNSAFLSEETLEKSSTTARDAVESLTARLGIQEAGQKVQDAEHSLEKAPAMILATLCA